MSRNKLCLLLCVCCITGYIVINISHIWLLPQKWDYQIYARCTHTFFHKKQPYAISTFREECFYPVAVHHFFKSFFLFPSVAKATMWNIVIFLATIGCLLLPFAIIRWSAFPASQKNAMLLMSPLIFSEPFQESVSLGNMSCLAALAVLSGIFFLQRKRAAIAGVILGLGGVLKLYPLYLVFYLLIVGLWRKESDKTKAGFWGLGLFFLIQVLFWSSTYWTFLLSSKGMANSLIKRGGNVSLLALIERFGYPTSPIFLLLLLGIPLGVFILKKQQPFLVECNLVILVMLMTNPAQWAHTFTIVLLPLVTAVGIVITIPAPTTTTQTSLRKLNYLLCILCCLVFWQPEHFATIKNDLFNLSIMSIASIGFPFALSSLLIVGAIQKRPFLTFEHTALPKVDMV